MIRPERIISEDPAIGVVVGTAGSLPYVHLHLEAARRLYPQCPILINDDCSAEQTAINDLCAEYGADYSFSTTKLGHMFGDCAAFWNGLLWAKRKRLDLLVKFSRRFVPLNDFRPSLRELALRTQAATYSSVCRSWHFGFRTEAMAMHVPTWLSQHQIGDFRDRTARGDMLNGLPESFFHTWAGNVHPPAQTTNTGNECFGLWEWSGFGRRIANPNFLWHESARTTDYAYLAAAWNLPYSAGDFQLETMPSTVPLRSRSAGPTIAIIIPTIGRPSLAAQLDRLVPQLRDGDELLIVGDGEQQRARELVGRVSHPAITYLEHRDPLSTFGNAQRNYAVERSRAEVLWFCDDDDLAAPYALAAIRDNVRDKPVMFRMFAPNGTHLWKRPEVTHGNVGGAMLALPRSRFQPWPVPAQQPTISDLHWIKAIGGDCDWNHTTIYHTPQRGWGK